MKSFFIIIDFENLFIKSTINNYNILLFSEEKLKFLNNLPSIYFEDFWGVIITHLKIYKIDNLYVLYRGEQKIEVVLESYFENNLKFLDFSYFGVILDLERNRLVVFGSFFFYKQKYKDSYFIFSDFELFYKLSEITINENDARNFIKFGKFDIIECENKILTFDFKNKQFMFEDMIIKRKKIKKHFKIQKLPEKFYYLLDIKDFIIFEHYKFQKLPIKAISLYQLENLYNMSFELDFEKEIITDVHLRSLINYNFEEFYKAYKFFNLKNWLLDFIFNPIVIYRAFILYSIIRNFRL
ncbi:MAG: hypothetical protein ABIL13_02175 [candidate division WOR-3 bacterium]